MGEESLSFGNKSVVSAIVEAPRKKIGPVEPTRPVHDMERPAWVNPYEPQKVEEVFNFKAQPEPTMPLDKMSDGQRAEYDDLVLDWEDDKACAERKFKKE